MAKPVYTARGLKRRVGTSLDDTESHFTVSYRGTVVYHHDKANNRLTLNTGGWFTATTKSRMNDAARIDPTGWSVYQEKGEWYAWHPGYLNIYGTHRERFKGDSATVPADPSKEG